MVSRPNILCQILHCPAYLLNLEHQAMRRFWLPCAPWRQLLVGLRLVGRRRRSDGWQRLYGPLGGRCLRTRQQTALRLDRHLQLLRRLLPALRLLASIFPADGEAHVPVALIGLALRGVGLRHVLLLEWLRLSSSFSLVSNCAGSIGNFRRVHITIGRFLILLTTFKISRS